MNHLFDQSITQSIT